MAYCRFSDADIYLYPAVSGGVECCACPLAAKVPTIFTLGGEFLGKPVSRCERCKGKGCESCMMHGDTSGMSWDEAIEHVQAHVAAGHNVPADVLVKLDQDKAAEAAERRAR